MVHSVCIHVVHIAVHNKMQHLTTSRNNIRNSLSANLVASEVWRPLLVWPKAFDAPGAREVCVSIRYAVILTLSPPIPLRLYTFHTGLTHHS